MSTSCRWREQWMKANIYFWIFQFRICINASIAHAAVQSIHYHGKLHWWQPSVPVVEGEIMQRQEREREEEEEIKITYSNFPICFRSCLTCFQWTRNAANEHSFPRIQRHRSVKHVISIGEAPWTNLHGLVLDSRRWDANVEFLVFDDAAVN